MRLRIVVLAAALLAMPACKKADPNSVEDQVERLQKAKTNKERVSAIENLRKIGKKEAVPGLVSALENKEVSGEVKEKAAVVLGELKDPSSVKALTDALDPSASSSDKSGRDANAANKEIVRALGEIGDKAAVDAIIQIAKVTKDNYVKIEAINTLGKLKDPKAVELLSAIATDERIETFINKKAIQALSLINDPRAMPVYFRMMFLERKGMSFYPESSYGLFLLGEAAQDKVLTALKGEDKELMALAKEREILEPAIYAKAAQVEADLQDKRAVPVLMKLLKYEDDNLMYKLIVRMQAADTLGRMRVKEAAPAIAAMLNEDEANARGAYERSLVQIGDKSIVPQLDKCATAGNWSAREVCMLGLALIGDASSAKSFEAFLKDEPKRFDSECKDGMYGEVDCNAEKAKEVEKRTKVIAGYKKVLDEVASCKDNKCLEAKLNDAEPIVRERAAYELGRRGAVESLPALIAAIQKDPKDAVDLNPRFAAICAVDWIASTPEGKAAGKQYAQTLEAQVEKDSQKTLTMKIAEEVKRLAVKLGRS